jgi:A/G-specific adenine glycosylase
MPWRNTKDPYKIWVSEIMLQQTRVDTVIPYYERFIERFESVLELANAQTEEVYKYWQGLGYYRRADNLHKGAQMVAFKYGGKFPKDPKEAKEINGIGPYTLGAVLSIAFGVEIPAVDGNVMRVLSRQFLIEEDIAKAKSRKIFEEKVMQLIGEDASSFNQGLMELGAMICTPLNPKCTLCPMKSLCQGYKKQKVENYPVKSKKEKSKIYEYKVLIIKKEDTYWLEKRPNQGLLANLWGFPLIEKEKWEQYRYLEEKAIHLPQTKHIFTHRVWEMEPIIIEEQELLDIKKELKLKKLFMNQNGGYFTNEEIDLLPIGTAFMKVVKEKRDHVERGKR